jgi:hypothetical protein
MSNQFDAYREMLLEYDCANETLGDVISLNVPLLIRILEAAREDIKNDVELHEFVENIIKIRDRGVLTMVDYDDICACWKKNGEKPPSETT